MVQRTMVEQDVAIERWENKEWGKLVYQYLRESHAPDCVFRAMKNWEKELTGGDDDGDTRG